MHDTSTVLIPLTTLAPSAPDTSTMPDRLTTLAPSTMPMTSSEIAQPAGDDSEGGTSRKPWEKLVEMPKDTRTVKKMWKDFPDEVKKDYSNRATAMSRAAGGADGTTSKLRGRNKAKEHEV
ncbi:hypothetical protein NEOLEDRAFT_1179677 [Neolentinus lepideus HHB14362 ss-1]|uniref:Uncharacterized protein n=1 Tax=Neolentinus lepideus HHB14362 ss-1 TaxID=1314782 RepID=A0A165RK62_9AGAM|nr:hypothetical protein NEOLEDRAFT_1179677 [Neolentinus lepideus HHB14362 ss-1]